MLARALLCLFASLLAAAPAAAQVLEPRAMTVETERDPITDALRAQAVARGDGARLQIGCDPDRHEGVRIRFTGRAWLPPERLLTGRRTILYRFDGAPPGRSWWSTEGRTATLRPAEHVLPFLRWLVVSERLVLRHRDIENRRVTLVFPLAGAAAAVDAMLAACGEEALRAELFAGG